MDEGYATAELAEDLRQAIGTFVRRARAGDAVGHGHAAVLGHLARHGKQSIADLATRERVRHQSMARTVKNLAVAGLIETTKDPGDARRVIAQIAPQGRSFLERERRRRAQWIAEAMMVRLTAEERSALAALPELLRKLAQ